MTKQEYLRNLESFELDPKRFCIIAGGVMLMYGLRAETDDIDIKMSSEYFEEVKKKLGATKSSKFDYLWAVGDQLEIAVLDYEPEDVVEIDGFLVEKIEQQLEWKLRNGRTKDVEDIRLIREYLGFYSGAKSTEAIS